MRVIHVVPDLSPASGGQAAAAVGLCEGLAEAGLDVALVATDHRINGATPPAGVAVRTVPCSLLPRWRWSSGLIPMVQSLLDPGSVVHIHGLWQYPTWSVARLCRGLGVPYVVGPCGMLERWSLSERAWRKRAYVLLLERTTLHGAAAFHFTSDAERVRSLTFGSRAPAYVVPLGLRRQTWESLPARGGFRRRLGLGDAPTVLYLSRLHPKKRPELLLEGFSHAAQEFSTARLVLAGPGDPAYVLHLQRLASQLGLAKRVVFAGALGGHAVQEAFVDADVFVLPSLQENFGLAVAEAMAAGCPVVISPHVALAEDVEKYSAGIVVELEANALGDVLRQLLRDSDARRIMGENGRRLVLERYTWDPAAQAMIGVYEDILAGTRKSPAWR